MGACVSLSVCFGLFPLLSSVGALGMKTTSHPRYKQDVLPHWFREHPAQCWWRQDVLPTEGNAFNGRITNDPRLGGGKTHVTRSRPMGWADIGTSGRHLAMCGATQRERERDIELLWERERRSAATAPLLDPCWTFQLWTGSPASVVWGRGAEYKWVFLLGLE